VLRLTRSEITELKQITRVNIREPYASKYPQAWRQWYTLLSMNPVCREVLIEIVKLVPNLPSMVLKRAIK
jgi:hypothetical protein